MICSTLDVCIFLHKIISLYDSPLQRTFNVFFASVDVTICEWSLRVAPSKERTILADCVNLAILAIILATLGIPAYLFLIAREPRTQDAFSMACKGCRNKTIFGIEAPDSSCDIFCGTQEEARIAGPFYTLDSIVVPSMHSMPNKRRIFKTFVCI